ncbi:cytochrome c oxidase subunit I [Singulisphaera acidiphila]|uniref:Heme/copper-type cytochrome/quinol oxidase, subunit 1 n=1 Tax=Singulisphaera acidiphila (strain ATCC BAA-1392 / DSM 18658 / VKM B-2454 / MOB10) TaxID=886293 RepID=L0DRE5_SINAD|nr:cbb3-type cytochrome c oxidase subunit I [Singulisphaera acidiphila]AGA30946.1 heme/copper-type cytochrome/quinol oxidase, subunit 1 [Singulisphaera acidiphila DSM 18658]
MSAQHAANGHGHGHTADSHGHDHIHPAPSNILTKYVFSTDHKVIGIQFLISGLLFFVLGGLLAMAVRWQLAWPWSPVPILSKALWSDPALGYRMPPEYYNKLFTMHASIMIFFVIIPLLTGAFGNFLIPLMIGARDMAFPKLNMFSYWAMPFAMVAILYSFYVEGGSAEAGWTSYPVLSIAHWSTPGSLNGQTWWLVALLFAGISSLMGSINYITTVLMLRAPGMKMFRMPMSVWALFITAILQAFALPVLTSALVMQLLDRTAGTNFFSPIGWSVANAPPVVGGGQTLMWQHLFWFYSHPAVYIMILPAMGFVSDVIATFSRKPLFGYKPMVFAIAGIAGLGFIVWGHHMFQSGMNPALGATFMLSTMMIALPSAVKVFNWLGTMWGGRLQLTTAMLNAMAFVAMFVIGGLSGIFMAATPVDMHIHDTYFIVAHIHYVLFGGSTFGIFAAIYYWFPKMFGRMMNERWGKIHFFLSFIFFNGTFFLMHIVGMHGMPRRYADYSAFPYLDNPNIRILNVIMTYSAFGLGLAQIPFAINFFYSMVAGPKAGSNPWKANSLEWATQSPPPHYNFETIPTVYHPAYEFSVPGMPDDFLPQTVPRPAEAGPLDPVMA